MLRKALFLVLIVAATMPVANAQTGAANVSKDSKMAVAAQAQDEHVSKGGALYFNKEQVDKIFAASGAFTKEQNYQVMAGNRSAAGQAEVHAKDTDIFYIIDGSATFVTGGTVVDQKTTGPDEIRGASITGGEERQLSKGDVIIIPHGTPHWMKEVHGNIQYFVVKVR
jgi:mannose-6-phosphate isomerase-like protein (cupin superfamily)